MRFLDTSRIRTHFDIRILAEDGVELSVDLYLPAEPGSYPVLLHRTPADNNRAGRVGISQAPAEHWKQLAAQGYIVAAADVRGRGDSDGQFIPFVNEASDGAATIAWLRNFKEANGKVGLFGSGYAAFCAWAAACVDRRIDAIASLSPFGAVGEGLVHNNGAVRLDWLFWMHLIGGRTVQPANVPPWPSIYQHLPLATMDKALGRSDIWWSEWLAHMKSDDPFWASLDLAEDIATLNCPGLHLTGWWDGQLAAARYYYQAAVQSDSPQHLIIGPWDTDGVRRPQPTVGGFDFGPRSVIDIYEELALFFNEYLKGEAPVSPRSSCRLFATGRNDWVNCQTWPTATQEKTLEYFLDSTMGANTRRGDGQLIDKALNSDKADSIIHNPEVPVLFQPGFVSFATGAKPSGFVLEQAHITARDEALVYTSEPLKKAVTVSGRARVTLTVKTDVPDVDLFVLLSDSFPLDTRDLQLSHAPIRLSNCEEFKPNKLTHIAFDFGEIYHHFLPGHQIRLTITPSLFPLYARNLQTTDTVAAEKPRIANINIFLNSCNLCLNVSS